MKSLIVIYGSSEQDSQKFVNMISQIPELNDIVQYIDVDYGIINQMVRDASNIKVNAIPSLLLLSEDSVQLFETNKCFEYINGVVRNIERSNTQRKTTLSELWGDTETQQPPQQHREQPLPQHREQPLPQHREQPPQQHREQPLPQHREQPPPGSFNTVTKPKQKIVLADLVKQRSEVKITSPSVERGGGI